MLLNHSTKFQTPNLMGIKDPATGSVFDQILRLLQKTFLNIYDDLVNLSTWTRTATATDYTVLLDDVIVAVTSTASARTVTLPAVASVKVGKTYIIKDESGGAGTNNITIDGNGAETIDGAANKVISSNYGAVRLYNSGSAWFTW